ncbi:MAG: hypothetical protein KTR14_10720 [Vampirovibrio sp.]|nr:hypothetical protein [Vampirovibrio sp.]
MKIPSMISGILGKTSGEKPLTFAGNSNSQTRLVDKADSYERRARAKSTTTNTDSGSWEDD